MTAIDKYTRLEALGQWSESPDLPPREVVVSFENTTLVLSDMNENPLCHWAMAATSRLTLDGAKAVYTPDTEGFETLEINDAEMVEAIAQVSRAAITIKSRTPWLRWVFMAFLITGITAIFYAAPSLLRDQAVRMTGPESARKLGTDMVATLDADMCRGLKADAARELFQSRAFPDGGTSLVFVRNQRPARAFPGGVVVIGNAALQSMQSPDELAEFSIALSAQSEATMMQLFDASSPRELFDYITSGKLSEERLAQAARSISTGFEIGDIGNYTPPDQPLLRDQDWRTLQNICLE
ncbi:MAG: hypothetical protein COA53_12630 [Rhodobacteraceae bacterium]|nr:MAG: hypothetical protein COA53_12630 [Paracoccaceae bacterium]